MVLGLNMKRKKTFESTISFAGGSNPRAILNVPFYLGAGDPGSAKSLHNQRPPGRLMLQGADSKVADDQGESFMYLSPLLNQHFRILEALMGRGWPLEECPCVLVSFPVAMRR